MLVPTSLLIFLILHVIILRLTCLVLVGYFRNMFFVICRDLLIIMLILEFRFSAPHLLSFYLQVLGILSPSDPFSKVLLCLGFTTSRQLSDSSSPQAGPCLSSQLASAGRALGPGADPLTRPGPAPASSAL